MRIVSESIKHLQPRDENEMHKAMLEEIRYKEIAHLCTNEDPNAFCCLYCWDNNNITCKYFTNIKSALKKYQIDAMDTAKEVEEANYSVHRIFSLYLIDTDAPGIFSDDNGPIGSGGVKIIFDIEFQNGKVYFSAE